MILLCSKDSSPRDTHVIETFHSIFPKADCARECTKIDKSNSLLRQRQGGVRERKEGIEEIKRDVGICARCSEEV